MAARLRRVVVPGLFALVGATILIGLGVWQLQRLHWKEALIATVESRLTAPPIPAPGPDRWPTLDVGALEYQPVTVTGRFLHEDEADVVFTLSEPKGRLGGMGYLVMTPLRTDDGWLVYVDRGFVPTANQDPATRAAGQIAGETTVTGLVRKPHGRDWFMPGDNAAANQWFSRDPAAFALARGLSGEKIAPYLVDAAFDPSLPGGLPQGGETIVSFPNSHLQYAVTWFGLAFGLAAVFVVFARRQLKG